MGKPVPLEQEVRRPRQVERNLTSSRVLPVSVRGVSHQYHTGRASVLALDDITVDVSAGEFLSVLGPSGCGKSTLLLVTAGLLQASHGSVIIGSTEVTQPWTDLGFVFQDSSLLEWRTALRNVLLQAEVRGMDRSASKARATELLHLMKLDGFEGAYPSQLSGGMKQRVSLCRALLHDPPLLLMDEPFGALDSMTREQMGVDLQRMWMREPKTVVFVTHSIEEAVFLSDRIVVMSPRPGRISAELSVGIPRPRRWADIDSPRFRELVREARRVLMGEGVFEE